MLTTLFISAFGLGIAISAPPGPVTAEAVRRGAAHGFRAAFLLEAGSLIGDAFWAISALVGIAFLVQNLPARLLLSGLGVLLLLRLGFGALREARADHAFQSAVYSGGHFKTGMLISLANPFSVAFWLGVGGSVIAAQLAPGIQPQTVDFAVFFAGFMIGVLVWMTLACTVIAWGRRFINPPLFRIINLICGLALILFGIQLAWMTLTSLIG